MIPPRTTPGNILLPHSPAADKASRSERYRLRVMHDTKRATLHHCLIIILDDLDFGWTHDEIRRFICLWNQGIPLPDIAARLRPMLSSCDARDETALLAMHLMRKGRINLVK
ncbi:MAG: hypothetical protein SCK57_12470 [Bacillota bacterium]|nr:hypothetical protein [Bacillota bacterium]